jgi:hypothetical protein
MICYCAGRGTSLEVNYSYGYVYFKYWMVLVTPREMARDMTWLSVPGHAGLSRVAGGESGEETQS